MKISFMIGHISHAAQSYNNMYNYERVCVCVETTHLCFIRQIWLPGPIFDVPSLSLCLSLFTLNA